MRDRGQWLEKGAHRNEAFFRELVRDRFAQKLMEEEAQSPSFSSLLEEVRERALDPYTAVDRLMAGLEFKVRGSRS